VQIHAAARLAIGVQIHSNARKKAEFLTVNNKKLILMRQDRKKKGMNKILDGHYTAGRVYEQG
jgi:hypothetical protein